MADKIKTRNIKQSVVLNASAREVYGALMDSDKHSKFTGSPAKISPRVGGKFTAYDSYIEGENMELSPGKKIVQSWRATEWPEGYFSTVTYMLKEKGGKTHLTFEQKGIPGEFCKEIEQGWIDWYWTPLKKMFGGED